jgi:3D (Asp-Asp-Asp) domain-containing protein
MSQRIKEEGSRMLKAGRLAAVGVVVLIVLTSSRYTVDLATSSPFIATQGGAKYLGQYTVTAYACPEEADDKYFPDSSKRTKIRILKKDLKTVVTVDVKNPFLTAMNRNGCGVVNENPQGYNHLVQKEYFFKKMADFREVDQVTGAYNRVLIPRYSVAHSTTENQLKNNDRGYFIIKGTGARYEFRVDDKGGFSGKQIDLFYGVGKQAYGEALAWGRKQADLYKY